jgi:hypothetical protein
MMIMGQAPRRHRPEAGQIAGRASPTGSLVTASPKASSICLCISMAACLRPKFALGVTAMPSLLNRLGNL